MSKKRILVLCTQNSCRSQMTEGIIKNIFRDKVEVFSAGAKPAERVHPMAVKTLKDRGIDISDNIPKSLDKFRDESFDFVITTCNSARDSCPAFFGPHEKIHWDLEDPAAATGSDEDIAAAFKKTADELERRIKALSF